MMNESVEPRIPLKRLLSLFPGFGEAVCTLNQDSDFKVMYYDRPGVFKRDTDGSVILDGEVWDYYKFMDMSVVKCDFNKRGAICVIWVTNP